MLTVAGVPLLLVVPGLVPVFLRGRGRVAFESGRPAAGRLLEIVVLLCDDGEVKIIHVTKARSEYRRTVILVLILARTWVRILLHKS